MDESGKRGWERLWLVANWPTAVVVVVVAFGAGYLLRWGCAPARPIATDLTTSTADAGAKKSVLWTCSMHPQIKLPKPGLCPICKMPLIPLETDASATGGLRELRISPAAMMLLGIQTVPVERKFVEAKVSMVGKIDYDEARLKYITAWIPGLNRLDRLYVNYTGVPVKKGDHLVYMYSPELLVAQRELLEALRAVKELEASDIAIVRETAEAMVTDARDKLRLWGMKGEQIARIEKTGKTTDHMTIYAPIGGIVVHKHAQEGMYVKTGTRIYTIADLSQVWVRLDAYESDLLWLRLGQKVKFTTESYPGQVFTGTIGLIDPILTQKTRTVKVRVNAPNLAMKLKPGMFVRAEVRAKLAAGGKVVDAALAGKWICTMHPDVVKDSAGKCDLCGMPLVTTESQGYVSVDPSEADTPLVIPVTAALVTGGREAGSRAVVYVEIDPSRLTRFAVTRWQNLLATIRQRLKAAEGDGEFANVRCPIMSTVLGSSKVPADLTRSFEGREVAFCCAGCPGQWDKLTDAERRAKLAAASSGRTPFTHLWGLLSDGLRQKLLAVHPSDVPDAGVQDRFVREVNGILTGRELYDQAVWKGVQLGQEALGLLKRGLGDLAPVQLTRFNRLLLEKTLPDEIAKAKAGPTFEGREIVLGPRVGEYYQVVHGLVEGQRLVRKGAFALDAELQIQAKPSMMTPEGGGGGALKEGGGPGAKLPGLVRAQLHAVVAAARDADKAVRAGDLGRIRAAFAALGRKVKAVRAETLTGRFALLWKEHAMLLTNDAVEGGLIEEADQAKRLAELLAEHLAAMKSQFGLAHERAAASRPAISADFRRQFGKVVDGYLAVQRALAADKSGEAAAAVKRTSTALAAVDMKLLAGDDHMAWMRHSAELKKILAGAAGAKDIQAARAAFALLSEEMIAAVKRLGPPGRGSLYLFKCTMAFEGRGGAWLQADEEPRNPYYGSAMLRCHQSVQVIAGAGADGDSHE